MPLERYRLFAAPFTVLYKIVGLPERFIMPLLTYTPPPEPDALLLEIVPPSMVNWGLVPSTYTPPPKLVEVLAEISAVPDISNVPLSTYTPPPFSLAVLFEIVPPVMVNVLLVPTYTPPPLLAELPEIVPEDIVSEQVSSPEAARYMPPPLLVALLQEIVTASSICTPEVAGLITPCKYTPPPEAALLLLMVAFVIVSDAESLLEGSTLMPPPLPVALLPEMVTLPFIVIFVPVEPKTPPPFWVAVLFEISPPVISKVPSDSSTYTPPP